MPAGEDTLTREGDGAVFAAVIRPHRSLGPRGFRITMALVAGVAAAVALRFGALGVWPVTGFLGLDVLGLFIAFKVSYGRARAFEELRLTPGLLSVRRVSHRGEAREWRLNPAWTRLVRETHAEFGLQRLALVSGRQRIVIAGALSPDERQDFADALGAAMRRVERGY